jgi:ferrous iron transport protein A
MKSNVDSESSGGSCRLDELTAGQDAVVLCLEGEGPSDRRLMDLGLLPQTPVRLLRRAPMGDPSVYELRGYQLCLRRTEARRIRVRPTPPPAAE